MTRKPTLLAATGLIIAATSTAALVASVTLAAGDMTRPMSGNEWALECRSKNPVATADCQSYARGLADGMIMWRAIAPERAMCIDSSVITQQLVDVGLKFIRNNPEHRHMSAGWVLGVAFSRAWPCEVL